MFSFASPLFNRLGFDTERFRFAWITAIASIIALLLAHALGLTHPQWAAMTVWAAAQPWRENLLEKSWWRFAGTLSGVVVGVILIVLGAHHPFWLILGLSLWVATCSAIAQLQKNLVTYGTGLAGYSAAMVSMLSLPAPEKISHMAFDRLSTVLLGVLTAVVVCYFFTPKRDTQNSQNLSTQVQSLFYQTLYQAFALQQKPDAKMLETLWQKIALLDELYAAQSIGTHKHRQTSQQNRVLLLARCQVLLSLQNGQYPLPSLPFSPDLPSADAWQNILKQTKNTEWHSLLAPLAAREQNQTTTITADDDICIHRDYLAAKQTFVRSFVSLGTVGLLWLMTDWAVLPYLMLGLSVMLSLFASFENPAIFMRNVIKGQALGAAAALLCMWTLWPFAQSSNQMVWMMLPFIISCTLVFAYRPLVLIAFDYIMVLLILLQPSYPMHLDFYTSVGNALAIVAGPVIALLSYRYIYPIAPQKRHRHILQMVIHSPVQKPHEKAQFTHRLLQALLLAQKNPDIPSNTLAFFNRQWQRKNQAH